jgi:hypothetical protein
MVVLHAVAAHTERITCSLLQFEVYRQLRELYKYAVQDCHNLACPSADNFKRLTDTYNASIAAIT